MDKKKFNFARNSSTDQQTSEGRSVPLDDRISTTEVMSIITDMLDRSIYLCKPQLPINCKEEMQKQKKLFYDQREISLQQLTIICHGISHSFEKLLGNLKRISTLEQDLLNMHLPLILEDDESLQKMRTVNIKLKCMAQLLYENAQSIFYEFWEGMRMFHSLAKEARDIEHKCTPITLDDANAVAKHRIMNHTFKKPLVTEFDCPRIITSTIARLRTEHLKGMKIHPDKTRSYVQCKHCPDLQLTPNHILECLTVATKLLKMGMVPLRGSLRELLYSPDAPRIAEAVIKTFDGI
ncbi:hypothetical protein TNCV_3347641 [Trichonephila clavipes]|nr:hypothetical protein TNCV_3347641 [Trichonephila clavipes]